jgi:methylaspartate mutase sigma subunit
MDRAIAAAAPPRPTPAAERPGDPRQRKAERLRRHATGGEPAAPAAGGLSVLVTSVSSDSHTWNLVFLQLALEELGHRVRNLGACVPEEMVVAECRRARYDLVVVSSVNGHGFRDGERLIGAVRACPELAALPVVIGGKLGIGGPGGRQSRARLRSAGFDAVFEEGAGVAALASFAAQLTASPAT